MIMSVPVSNDVSFTRKIHRTYVHIVQLKDLVLDIKFGHLSSYFRGADQESKK